MPNLVHDMEMSFQQLPSELVINVLCNLDLCTLMRLARTATATKKFIELHGEVIYRHVVYGSLLEGRITCPSSGVMEAVKSVNDLPTVFSPSIVGELLGTMSDLYDRLSSWAEFAEVQAKLNRNWTDGPYRMNLQTMKVGGNWRFKLNPAERTVITSVVAGGLRVFDRIESGVNDANMLFQKTLPGQFPHLEFAPRIHNTSEHGYVALSRAEHDLVVLRSGARSSFALHK